MHWVIQRALFKTINYELLVSTLQKFDINFTSISILPKTNEISPNPSISGRVYICGAIRLKAVAEERGWKPGSFLNQNFRFDRWQQMLGQELLNVDTISGKFEDIVLPFDETFFIRPAADNKAFDGMVIDRETLINWRSDKRKKSLRGLDVIISSVKQIYREYRIFVVNKKTITGSNYKVGGRPEISKLIDNEVYDYVDTIIKKWIPAESFVIDISLSKDGFKVIEFNNINSSGFYAIDMDMYVQAIQQTYSEEPKFRCANRTAIDELVAEYHYPYEDWMQDWPYEIADPDEVENYFRHYDEQTDDDRKFILMEMLIQAVTDTIEEDAFIRNWNLLRLRIIQDFKTSEHLVYYWCRFGEDTSDCWKVTPYMRELWKELNLMQ